MEQYKVGDLVYAKLGVLPAVGTVVSREERTGRYLIRFSAVQQDWYPVDSLTPYRPEGTPDR